MSRQMWVYILASHTRVLYVGVTNDMQRRWAAHRDGTGSRFTARYRIHRLVYCERAEDPRTAICREKQIKGWRRARKVELIEGQNPRWSDLAEEWGWNGA